MSEDDEVEEEEDEDEEDDDGSLGSSDELLCDVSTDCNAIVGGSGKRWLFGGCASTGDAKVTCGDVKRWRNVSK